ncbi:MAG: carbohydrate kinase family protein [Candidatus Azambacteria bacterium]|nr:carbohydrate kinase family protein [Candidatus Azambacteria bacterium]
MKKYDFIAIGDTVTDAFIHIKEASAHIDIDKGAREICMKFADKIPYDEVYVIPAVGNSANASVAAARLGLKSALVSNIGDDYFGQECLDAFKKENVAMEFIKAHKGQKTNYHYVLWYEDDRTILIKHEKYDYKLYDFDEPAWIYLSSLGENSLPFHMELEKFLNNKPEIKLAFQPGTFQMKFGREALQGIYNRSDLFLCNKEESQRILETEENDIKKLLNAMAVLGPKIVVITDGVKGAYSYDGKEMLFMRPYPDPAPPLERTGAGDAFSSTFTAALALGKSVRESLMWAPVNPMSVVQQIGARAGLLTREQIEEYLKKAPEDYIPKILE